MSCLGCEGVRERPVTLLDARIVCSDCPDWLFECEARYTAKLATNEFRKSYLALVEESRGKAAASALREAAWGIVQTR